MIYGNRVLCARKINTHVKMALSKPICCRMYVLVDHISRMTGSRAVTKCKLDDLTMRLVELDELLAVGYKRMAELDRESLDFSLLMNESERFSDQCSCFYGADSCIYRNLTQLISDYDHRVEDNGRTHRDALGVRSV